MAFALFSCFTTSSCYQELDDKELIVERLEANARFTKLCQSVECSEFPLNYHSSRIGETWYFFPLPGRHEEYYSSPGRGGGPTYVNVYPEQQSDSFYEMTNVDQIRFEPDRIVTMSAKAVTLGPGCCQRYEHHFNVESGELDFGFPQIRIYRPDSDLFLASEIAAQFDAFVESGEYNQISDEFVVRRAVGSKAFSAISRHPMLQSQYVKLKCSINIDLLCDAETLWPVEPDRTGLRVVGMMLTNCGDADCGSDQGVSNHLKMIEKNLTKLDRFVDLLAEHPDNRRRESP